MNFNFNTTAGATQQSSVKSLEGNKIHDVTFNGVEKALLKNTYNVLHIKFSNEDGAYTETVFEPNEQSLVRRITEKQNGEKVEQVSGIENMMLLFKHLIDAVNPKLAEAIDNGTKNLGAASWEALQELMIKATTSGIGTKTKIKLIKNKQGYARFPYFSRIRKEDGKAIVSNNFIGDKVYFSDYELNQQAKQSSATPTPVSTIGGDDLDISTPNTVGYAGDGLGDLDFDV